MNSRIQSSFLLFTFVFIISGCAAGHKYSYSEAKADLTFAGSTTVFVAVHDQRTYIKTEAKRPDFVGLQRTFFALPHDVYTVDGKPLSENMTQAITYSLKEKGFNVTPVTITHSENIKAVLNKLDIAKAGRLVLVIIKEWKTDTLKYSKLMYNLIIRVYDSDKHILAERTILSDGENIGINPEKSGPIAMKEKLEDLMNDPAIAASLK